MMFMNEHEIEYYYERYAYATEEVPNLAMATEVLYELMNWTNRNSDGWPYWSKPVRAAKSLMVLIQDATKEARWASVADIDPADLRKALAPIKSFRTRNGLEFHTGLEALLRGEN